jgi:hypothetical protein
MVGDIKLDLAQTALTAQISHERLGTLLQPETVVGFFAGLPFLGRVLEVTCARLRNPADRWVNNDLNDLHFLACAAGYADHVVAEKKTGHPSYRQPTTPCPPHAPASTATCAPYSRTSAPRKLARTCPADHAWEGGDVATQQRNGSALGRGGAVVRPG